MPIGSIIARAWRLTWRHRFLWIFGLLAGGSSLPSGGGWGSGSVDEPAGESGAESLQDVGAQAYHWLGGIDVAHATPDFMVGDVSGWVIAGALALAALLIYLAVTFQASLIWSIDRLDSKKTVTFWTGWHAGRAIFWRALLLGLYFVALALGALLILGLPIFLLISAGQPWIALAVGIPAFLLLLVWCVALGVSAELAERFLVLDGLSVNQSVRAAFQLLRDRFGNVALLWLVHTGLTVGIGLVLLTSVAVVGLSALLVGVILFGVLGINDLPSGLLLTLGITGGGLLLILLLTVSGWAGSFLSAFWTLGYRQLEPR